MLILLLGLSGCSRSHYRTRADRQSYSIIHEKGCYRPWSVDGGFSIEPNPESRLYNPQDPDRPVLPSPQPELYSYNLPPRVGDAAVVTEAGPSAPSDTEIPRQANEPPEANAPSEANNLERGSTTAGVANLPLVPIPASRWEDIPKKCLARMFEFESVVEEFELEYKSPPSRDDLDSSPRLSLEDIVELGVLNSREYQTQKESLYQTALNLTLERFDYATKFLATGNGAAVDYDHVRVRGITTDTLAVPSSIGTERMLATGGSVLARLANDVVLTFNGPDGFAEDISSELFFEISQTVFQRDILFEPLIQSERDVVYGLRDYARFRKTFFFDLASRYYTLLRTYRQIEIEAQNYFSLVRALNQAEAEERAGFQSRIQVEQIEQNVLDGRSRLITRCNDLERGLDELKILMGLPTETPINLDLSELDRLTKLDENAVASERVRRAHRRLQTRRQKARPDRSEVLNASIDLIGRLFDWFVLREQLGSDVPDREALRDLQARLRVDEGRLETDLSRRELERAKREVPALPDIQIFQRNFDVLTDLYELSLRQWELLKEIDTTAPVLERLQAQQNDVKTGLDQLDASFEAALEEARIDDIVALRSEAERLLIRVEQLVQESDRLISAESLPGSKEALQINLAQADRILAQGQELLSSAAEGLVAVEISTDDAMMTALVERLDLMNQRGELADDWRAVKLAADDLKSILNLNASQTIRTRSDRNRPLAFTLDDSRTELRLALDLPLNRRAQRNDYRRRLINYNNALRNFMAAEDDIKLVVRNRLRGLDLSREQFRIRVASAALAAERVLSTRLSLALGLPDVAARDFLEAQDAYRDSLTGVADNHIGYLVDRTAFFLDLELMQLDDAGFWPQIFDERYQPTASFFISPAYGSAYGNIPSFLKVSKELRRMFTPLVLRSPVLPETTDSPTAPEIIEPEESPALDVPEQE